MTVQVDQEVVFFQKVNQPDGQKPLVIERVAIIAELVSDDQRRCEICKLTKKKHNPRSKHGFTAEKGELAHLDIQIPQGPEYDSLTGENLSPEIQTHRREYVLKGGKPNNWKPKE